MNNKTISRCIKFALAKASEHPYYVTKNTVYRISSFRHFSFIIQGTTIVGWGWNHHGDAPSGFGYIGGTVHAEVHAYERSKDKLKGTFEVLNIRLNRQNALRLSSPCMCCMKFLKIAGCKHVYFSTDVGIASMKL